MGSENLEEPMLKHVWNLHGTQKTIAPDQESISIFQVTKGVDKHRGIRLHPSMAYHLRAMENQRFPKSVSSSMY